jgi:hypothetical protein
MCDESDGVCKSARFDSAYLSADRGLRGAYLEEPITTANNYLSVGPMVDCSRPIKFDGDKIGTCGPDPNDPLRCGPAVNRQCAWKRGRDECCIVDPSDPTNGYCGVCRRARKGIHVFSPDTFSWQVQH